MSRYEIIQSISKGGMGEVFLAHDPFCERQVALKKIRDDLKKHPGIRARFLKEAYLTAELTHPGVISIYFISNDPQDPYYVMPYVKGRTLKLLLNEAHKNMRQNVFSEETSIGALLPLFKSLCQTVVYAHSKGILHRDLKPENVLVGEFGEVIVLDWGLAEQLHVPPEKEASDIFHPHREQEITNPGKIVGTVAYMAPERALGAEASFKTEIYALGVILYQILTLHLPFNRQNIKAFQKIAGEEELVEPEEVAPYRDITSFLSATVKKCLNPNPDERFDSVAELLGQVMSYMEGRAEWFESAQLSLEKKEDWAFQENVLISKHTALSQEIEAAEWVSLMVSKVPFNEDLRIQVDIELGPLSEGIGFLINVPEASEREEPFAGYCLWLENEEGKTTHLFRNTVEVMQINDLFLTRKESHRLLIEKSGHHIHLWVDGVLRLTYVSYLPLRGTHIGVLSKDADYKASELVVYMGMHNLQVSCLAIPDAFLSSKNYKEALLEYRRVAAAFPGHAEGREALFRGGVTLLEQAKKTTDPKEKEKITLEALLEFEKLRTTPAAPLEYLGKALVYEAEQEWADETNCLELALRRYPHHPQIGPIEEQVITRMHESSQKNRRAAYRLILVALRFLPKVVVRTDTQKLVAHLIKNWEMLPFLEHPVDPSLLGHQKTPLEEQFVEINFAIPLAFWLANPHTLNELFLDLLELEGEDKPLLLANLLYCLLELGATPLARELMEKLKEGSQKELSKKLAWLTPLVAPSTKEGVTLFKSMKPQEIDLPFLRTLHALAYKLIDEQKPEEIEPLVAPTLSYNLSKEDQIPLDALRIWAYLLQDKLKEAATLFDAYPLELLNQESTLLHTLFGCYLYLTEGEEIASIHFAGVIETPFPRSWALLAHYLNGNLTSWFNYAFMWEKRALYRQLALFYRCQGDEEKETHYTHLALQEWLPS